jgi:hypothetical protein
LAFGACVKKCPKLSENVDCKPPTYITNQAENYVGCVYSLTPVQYGEVLFRYDTELFGGKFCVPSAEALAGPSAAALTAF